MNGKIDINAIVRKSVSKILSEAENRDAYVNATDGSGNYTLDNAKSLRNFFFDPQRKINNGGLVNIVYVEEAAVNKTFRNGGYTDSQGNVVTAQDIEKQGRAFNKGYINDFFDSDEYKNKQTKKLGGKRPFAVFTTVSQTINWAVMNYGKAKDAIDKTFANVSDADLDDFAANDPDFQKRVAKFKELNPDMADEIGYYTSTGSFPRDIINKIMATKLADRGGKWMSVDNSPYVSRHESTGSEALRLTKSGELPARYQSYVVLADGSVRKISRDEYFFLQRAFGGAKKTNVNAVEGSVKTALRSAIDDINDRYSFRNYLIPQIAKMSFTVGGKPVTYKNHELQVGNITIDADDFLNSPMAEGVGRKITITESELRETIRNILREVVF